MKLFICKKCGHVAFGAAPQNCPVCWATQDQFAQNDNAFKESAEKSKEGAVKHIPAVTVNKKCSFIPEVPCVDIAVRIGATLHPMEDKHFIQFIDCYVDSKYVSRMMLTPGVSPAAVFHLRATGAKVQLIERCNLHGWWMTEVAL
jgi:superoxide reductase